VLQDICKNANGKQALMEWLRELTPLDVNDFQFPEVSLEGKIQLQLIESENRKISAESASDGTLRFLACAAALLGTDPARCYFFEELENGIHPNRAHLLVQLVKKAASAGKIQVIGTTHSPALLGFLDGAALNDASLVHRDGGMSQIYNFRDNMPALGEAMKNSTAGQLLNAGWFETAAAYMGEEPT
jgi:predicted ATPase